MTTVTGLTADRMLAIEAASVVDGDVVGDNLILTKHDGTQINAGSVRGPQGVPGPIGQDLAVLTAAPVLDIGIINQIRAGRQLTAADFTNMGLSAPVGLWNLSDLTDVSGNGRNLLNKGGIGFASGINGAANTAAQFTGDVNKAFYISDTGVGDPFKLRTGSWGCWLRTAKIGTVQNPYGKMGAPGQYGWQLQINGANVATAVMSTAGNDTPVATGVSNVCDDHWHFVVATCDGSELMLYVDGTLEAATAVAYPIVANAAPLNIGGTGADSSTVSSYPWYGRIDEAFVTYDILSEDEVRNLYCAKIPHTLAAVPGRVTLNVRRRRRGATLAVADFPTQPLRLHNFSGGSLGDEGSNGVALANQGAATNVSGADGAAKNAYAFDGSASSFLYATDVGLPSGAAPRTLGIWFKAMSANACYMTTFGVYFGIGIQNGGYLISTDGSVNMLGPFVCDAQWHLGVLVSDSTPVDGLKERMYLDGRLVTSITTPPTAPSGGSAKFRVGCLSDGSSVFTGQVDGVFICDYALKVEDIVKIYAKGSQALALSPKNSGDHVEAMDANSLFTAFDALDSTAQIDLRVAV